MKTKKLIVSLLSCAVVSAGIVIILYAFSEDIVHRNNGFIRRYPPHPITLGKHFNVKFNSYYIAGITPKKVYLGNNTAPLRLLILDSSLDDSTSVIIRLQNPENYNFKNIKLYIQPPYFYITDGTIPIIERGKIGKWTATPILVAPYYFSQLAVIDSLNFIIRTNKNQIPENILGKISLDKNPPLELVPEILKKQKEGVFDTDGQLLFNQELRKALYVYYYRNKFIVIDSALNKWHTENTIDTITQSIFETGEIPSKNIKVLTSPPIIVNAQCATSENLLFIRSKRLGKYEPNDMLKESSIIDVYDIIKNEYVFSFYLYDYKGMKMKDFQIYNHTLYAISGNYLLKYQLGKRFFNQKYTAQYQDKIENL